MQAEDRFPFKQRFLNRRSFLKMSGLLGLGVASAAIISPWAETVRFNGKMHKVSRTRLGIGTFVSMTLIHDSKDRAEEAIAAANREIDRLVALMNRFDPTTPLAGLNREGFLKDAPEELIEVVQSALHYHALCNGCFDCTVAPVIDLFQKKMGGENAVFPEESEIRALLTLVGSEKIDLKGRSISFRESGMAVTLDGIAKGYIVDKAAEAIERHGISNFLINAGGEIRTRGEAGRKPWTVAVQDPGKRSQYPQVIKVRDATIATSGNYEVFFDREKMFHHIVDPKNGHSPAFATSVSVMARTTMESDALATAVFVMPPADGVGLVNSLPWCESLVISNNGSMLKSRGWPGTAA